MAKHIWSVLCRRALIDRNSNSASLIETLEEITVELNGHLDPDTWTPLPVEATIVTLLSRSDMAIPERLQMKVELVGPNNETYISPPKVLAIDLSEAKRARVVTTFATMPIRGSGIQRFIVQLEELTNDWRQVAEIPLAVEIHERSDKPPVAPTGTPTGVPAAKTRRKRTRSKA